MEKQLAMKSYYRAATLIIEKSYLNTDRPTLILFKNRKWNVYANTGGRIEGKTNNLDRTLKITAIRELREETLNLLNLNTELYDTLKYKDIYNALNKKHYRTFLIPINGNIIDESIYYKNLEVIKKKWNVSPVWKETNDIKRFYLDELIMHSENVSDEYFYCDDVYGTKQKIYHFVMNELNAFNSDGLINRIIDNYDDDVEWNNLLLINYQNTSNNFLTGTNTYVHC